MPNTVLGKVSLTPRGAYSAEVAYTALDLVGYENGGYIALQSVQGVTPSNDGVNWMLLAGQGGTGPQGVQGPPGAVYTPTVSPEGVISWTNNGDLTNPDPVDITGPAGPTGATGASVASIERTSGTGAPGTTDTYTVKLTDGSTAGTFQVYNGKDGTGAGDFKADGTVPMTGNLQMGGNRVTGLGSAQDATDAVNKSDLKAALAGKADLTLSNLTNPQQALANLGAGVRPNLADNCDFTNPVNTVGFTSGTYSNDFSIFNRWDVQSLGNSITATLTATGLQVNTTASNQGIRQAIDAKNFSAQLYTSSVIIDGVLYSAQFPKPTGSGVIIQYPGSNYSLAITPYGDDWFWYPFVEYQAEPMEVTISHCKLEEGEGQTLAYEDESGSLVVLPQPDSSYAVQLLRCQMHGTSSIVDGIGASPRLNLLGNAYFIGGGSQQGGGQLPVNQRGQTSWNAQGSIFDGWNISYISSVPTVGTATLQSDGLLLSNESGQSLYFNQVLPDGLSAELDGKTVTLSFLVSEMSGRWSIGEYGLTGASFSGVSLLTHTFVWDDSASVKRVQLWAAGNNVASVNVIAAKLEEGPNQTLAYQDDSGKWRLLPQPDMKYGAQLAECQRYLLPLNAEGAYCGSVASTGTSGRFFIPTPVEMRANPVIQGASFRIVTNGEAALLDSADFTPSVFPNGIEVKYNNGPTLNANQVARIFVYTAGYLSAEL